MNDDQFSNLPDVFYKKLLDSLDEGVYFVDRARRITFWNTGAEQISGFSSKEVVGKFCGDKILEHIDFEGNFLCGEGCPLTATIKDGKTHQMDVFLRHRKGHRLPVQVTSSPVMNKEGEIIGAVERVRDITPQLSDRNRMEILVSELHTDPLTRIANRRYLERVLQDKYYRFEHYHEKFGIMFIDLDKLKNINDQFGHAAGDLAITLTAQTLASTFRNEDVVGRWGGDEFVVILQNVDLEQMEKIKVKVKSIIENTRLPEDCGGGHISISIGLAEALDGDTPELIINRGDLNMYGDKKLKPQRE